jgi:hypothetical protein
VTHRSKRERERTVEDLGSGDDGFSGTHRFISVDHSADRLTCKNCGAAYTEEAASDRQEEW